MDSDFSIAHVVVTAAESRMLCRAVLVIGLSNISKLRIIRLSNRTINVAFFQPLHGIPPTRRSAQRCRLRSTGCLKVFAARRYA